MWAIKKKSNTQGDHSSRSNQETGEYWDYHKRGALDETMNSILDSIYESHCKHCGEWNEFDSHVCSECGKETT